MSKDDDAVQLVLEGKVQVNYYTVDDQGAIVNAVGTVQSSAGDHSYMVIIYPDGATCTCPYGQHHVLGPDSHKHDLALRLAAQVAYQKENL